MRKFSGEILLFSNSTARSRSNGLDRISDVGINPSVLLQRILSLLRFDGIHPQSSALSLSPLPRLSVIYSFASPKPQCVSFRQLRKPQVKCLRGMMRIGSFAVRASSEEATADSEMVTEDEIEDDSDGAPEVLGDAEEDASDRDEAEVVESSAPSSSAIAALQSYKEALASNDPEKISELESFLKSIEDEKINLEAVVASLSQELSTERDRILRISADFENFRRRTERERISLVENAQGEVVESLLPVLDNFERAKAQLKVETEGEEKINNSYQSIYKQFIEILNTLRVVPVETTGTAFDPWPYLIIALTAGEQPSGSNSVEYLINFFSVSTKLIQLHEAIMQEDSDEFEQGVILQEFRKGFQLGDRLLRPSMVKVSAGPGPAKPLEPEKQLEDGETKIAADTVEDDGSGSGSGSKVSESA
ncbi:unnamed protein product [Rhodiola kirilowii]